MSISSECPTDVIHDGRGVARPQRASLPLRWLPYVLPTIATLPATFLTGCPFSAETFSSSSNCVSVYRSLRLNLPLDSPLRPLLHPRRPPNPLSLSRVLLPLHRTHLQSGRTAPSPSIQTSTPRSSLTLTPSLYAFYLSCPSHPRSRIHRPQRPNPIRKHPRRPLPRRGVLLFAHTSSLQNSR